MSRSKQVEDMVNNMFDAYKQTSSYKDSCILEIAFNKKKYEDILNKMWANYAGGCIEQIVEYNKQVNDIKSSGFKVLRNSKGLHKIVAKEN